MVWRNMVFIVLATLMLAGCAGQEQVKSGEKLQLQMNPMTIRLMRRRMLLQSPVKLRIARK